MQRWINDIDHQIEQLEIRLEYLRADDGAAAIDAPSSVSP